MRAQNIEKSLRLGLPLTEKDFLVIDDESYLHAGRKGQESHFKVLVVSDVFIDLSRVQRQRRVNDLLALEFKQGLHALSLRLLTHLEAKNQEIKFQTPSCQGSLGKDHKH